MATVVIPDPNDEGEGELGKAAVEAAGVAGEAKGQSEAALSASQEAKTEAESAKAAAAAAFEEAMNKPSRDDVEAMVDSKLAESEERMKAALLEAVTPVETVEQPLPESVKPDPLPDSVTPEKKGLRDKLRDAFT
jgi:hypothetical protein